MGGRARKSTGARGAAWHSLPLRKSGPRALPGGLDGQRKKKRFKIGSLACLEALLDCLDEVGDVAPHAALVAHCRGAQVAGGAGGAGRA